jgi:predicted lipid-binding transport protein (Tim44 family)
MIFSVTSLSKLTFLSLVAIASLVLLTSVVDARVGSGGSFGSRGGRTFSTPPTTNTAPKAAAPIEKSLTQPGKSTSSQPAGFGGWRSILMGGLIAGAFASILGFGTLASVLGFLLQAALIVGVVWLVMSYFRNRNGHPVVARAEAAGGQVRKNPLYRQSSDWIGGGSDVPLKIESHDFDAFESLLGEIQLAYGRNDMRALGDRVTSEMLSYFAEELDANAKKGVRNEVSQPTLLQGDLAESWREADSDYATVAMRFNVIDATVDALSGRVVSGSKTIPQEVTEIWTFRRPRNGTARQWELSAIQQADKQLPLAS